MEIYIVSSLLVAVFGSAAAYSWLNQDHKDVLLGSDSDGFQPLGLGVLLLILGFALGGLDLTSAYLLKGLGLIFAAFGAFVLIPDWISDKILHPFMGVLYAIVAVIAYIMGTLATSGLFVYNIHALLVLVPLVALATFFATLGVLAFTSDSFRDRLEQDDGGFRLIIAGVVLMLVAPSGALVIITAGLGALLTTLGILIAIDDDQVEWLLAKSKAVVYAIGATIAFVAARVL